MKKATSLQKKRSKKGSPVQKHLTQSPRKKSTLVHVHMDPGDKVFYDQEDYKKIKNA